MQMRNAMRLLASVLLLGGCTPGQTADGTDAEAPASREHPPGAENVLLQEDFEHGLDDWVVEDKGEHHKVDIKDGKLIATMQEEMPGIFVWYKEDLPASFRLEYDFTPIERGKNNKGFFLLFFCARGKDGKDILAPKHWDESRLEDFRKYTTGDINCYHIGYLRGTTGLCNLRKNSGKTLEQSNKVPQLREGETYRVTLTKTGAHITFEIKGPGIRERREKFIDWTDPGGNRPVLGSGKLGFRQIGYVKGVTGAYDNVRIIDLTGTANAAASVVVDNSDEGFSCTEGWNSSTRDPGYEGDGYLWHRKGNGEGKAVFPPDLPRPGNYEVFVKWVASKPDDRATNAPWTIHHSVGETTVRVNMADIEAAGECISIGTYRFRAGNTGKVALTNDADNSVVADAVKFVFTGN